MRVYLPMCLGIGTLLGFCGTTSVMASDNQPNILLIHVDQQRYDALGYTGNRIVRTPNIDRLASQGMQFTNAFTPIPTSCPARQCLLSGKWPEQHKGLWNYDITLPVNLFDEATWTEKVQESGYKMGYVGKWHVHPTKTPLDFGFDDYLTYSNYNKWCQANNVQWSSVETGKTHMMGGYLTVAKAKSVTHWFVDQTIAMIDRYEAEGKPWHMRLDYSEPHLPCFPAKEFYDKYADVKIPKWGNFDDKFENKPYIQRQQVFNWGLENYTWSEWQQYIRSYYAVIEQIDDAIGILLNDLEKKGLTKNTVIVFTTDHGDAAGSHRMIDKHYVMYEEEVHVPMIIRWDGVVKAGSVCDNFVSNELDLSATLPEIAGVQFASQGASLLPLLKGQKVDSWRKYAFSNYNGQQFGLFVQRMIRDNRYKYVWNPTDTDEFYDLQKDPDETTNQINNKTYSQEIKRMRKDLYADLQNRKDPAAGRSSAAERQLLGESKQ